MRASILSIDDGNLNARVPVLSSSRRSVILLGGIVLKSRNRSWLFLASSLESFFLPAEDRLFSIPPLVGKVFSGPGQETTASTRPLLSPNPSSIARTNGSSSSLVV
jgi:hypothetical protein